MWYKVLVYFPASVFMGIEVLPAEIWEDAIRGDSPEHALARARWNWPAAEKVELV